ncbi:hypothetical protein [Actinomadura sp. 9N215]|uniref:hypothetical protein n=1 Tax=Actinomadura sp. 9N215 TaxID=3375150 RepID=UPI0037875A1B
MSEWLHHWLATRTGAASTVSGYASHVRLYLAPYLGMVVLAELSVAHLQAVFAGIAREHQARAMPLTAATLNRIRATLRTALNAAIRRGLIGDNPASRVELPTARRPRAVVWTAERVQHWQRTGSVRRLRCGRRRRPPSSSTHQRPSPVRRLPSHRAARAAARRSGRTALV